MLFRPESRGDLLSRTTSTETEGEVREQGTDFFGSESLNNLAFAELDAGTIEKSNL